MINFLRRAQDIITISGTFKIILKFSPYVDIKCTVLLNYQSITQTDLQNPMFELLIYFTCGVFFFIIIIK